MAQIAAKFQLIVGVGEIWNKELVGLTQFTNKSRFDVSFGGKR